MTVASKDFYMCRYTIDLPAVSQKLLPHDGEDIEELHASPESFKNTSYRIHPVTYKSSKYLRMIVETVASYFHREKPVACDTLLFSHHENPASDFGFAPYTAYLWVDIYIAYPNSQIVGACCFRHADQKYRDVDAMQWIWLHPYVRRIGLLSESWRYFEKQFPNGFDVEGPYSDAMFAFLKTRNFNSIELKFLVFKKANKKL